MSDVAEKLTRRRQFRNAAMVTCLVSAALLAGCVPVPPPPPPPQPVYYPAPPPPPPPVPVPVVRG
jgi:hypothetical protein